MSHELIIILQDSICTANQLECVNKLKVDTSSCQKQCSGLLVTGFTKSVLQIKDITEGEGLRSVFEAYYNYTKIEKPGK